MKTSRILLIITILSTILLAMPAWANWLGGIELVSGDTATFAHLQQAGVNYDFKVTNANGGYIAVSAYQGGSLVAGQMTGLTLSQPAGTESSGSNYIMFASGAALVDEIVVQMRDPITSDVLLEMRLPVDYRFGPHSLNNIDLSVTSPGWLRHGDDLNIDIDYKTDEAGGVLIGARPYTGGVLTPAYSASGYKSVPAGDGLVSQYFRFAADAVVDEVRLEMWTAGFGSLLLEVSVPVDLRWTNEGFTNITFDPPTPACLGWDQPLTVEFDFATSDPGGCFVFAQGLDVAGDPIPDQDTPLVPLSPVTGHATRVISFPPVTGEGEVAFVRLTMASSDHLVNLQEVDIPVSYSYGPNAVYGVTFYPASPAVLDNGEQVQTSFNYLTNEAAGIRIYGQPYSYAGKTPNYGISPSPLYTGMGNGVGVFTIIVGQALVNSLRMLIYDESAVEVLSACPIPCNYTFGGVGGVTPVVEVPAAGGPVLGQNYPNPFNPVTSIPVDMSASGRVVLKVYDLRGRLVRDLVDRELPAGRTLVPFDGRDLASGTYFYAIDTPRGKQGRRMQLVK